MGVPIPPSKTLIRPQNPASIESRRLALNAWIRSLCYRPDLRTSRPFIEFIEFESNTGIYVKPLTLCLQMAASTVRTNISDFFFIPEKPMLLSASRSSLNGSRIGMVWSLVDKSTESFLQLWNFSGLNSSNSYVNLVKENVPQFTEYCFHQFHEGLNCVFYHPETNRVFCGLSCGHIRVLNVKKTIDSNFAFEFEKDLPCHTESIICFKGFTDPVIGRLFSLSSDSSMRIISCETLNTICSGRIQKRLNPKETVTAGTLEPLVNPDNILSSRVFIGTSQGRVFVFSSESNPPVYVATIQLAYEISCIEVAGSNFLVCAGHNVYIYKLPKSTTDSSINLISTYTAEATFVGKTIQHIAIAKTQPLLFIAHRQALSMWNCVTHTCVCIKTIHYDITRIGILENLPKTTTSSSSFSLSQSSSIELITAGSDGFIYKWAVPDSKDLVLWESQELLTAQSMCNQKPPLPDNPDTYSCYNLPLLKSVYCEDADDDNLSFINNRSAVPHRH